MGFETEGHRADVTMIKAATALCAFEDRDQVTRRDLGKAAELALAHRIQEHGLAHGELDLAQLEELLDQPQREAGQNELSRGFLKKKTATS
jgi:Mg-chelatase subunit ChlI